MPSTVKGTRQFMAPEVLGFTAFTNSRGSGLTDHFAADMWSLGEIAFQMLTKQPAFPQPYQFMQYAQGLQPFPNSLLMQSGVSSHGQHFISFTMLPSPASRLKVAQAWNHEWMEKRTSSYLRPHLTTSARYCTPSRPRTSSI
jgi:serine/threonine protein kinase